MLKLRLTGSESTLASNHSKFTYFADNVCLGNILNGSLPTTCQSKAGESCDNFTCDAGFKRQTGVTELRCSEIGEWSYNLSSLCVGRHIDIS